MRKKIFLFSSVIVVSGISAWSSRTAKIGANSFVSWFCRGKYIFVILNFFSPLERGGGEGIIDYLDFY